MLGRPLLRSIWFDNQCILGSSGSFIGILITSSFNQAWLEVCTESSEFDYLDGYLGLYGMRSSMQVFASIVAHVSILFIAHRDTRTIRGFDLHSKHTYSTWAITLDFIVFPTKPGVNSYRSLASCSKEETWIDDRVISTAVRWPWVFLLCFEIEATREKHALRLAFGICPP